MPLWKTPNVNDPEFVAQVAAVKPDILIAIAFGQKLSDSLLATAPHGGINLHPSLLPAFRGAAPVNWAILGGHKNTGVSVIRISPTMDGGEILLRDITAIGEDETAGELHDRLARTGAALVEKVLDRLPSGSMKGLIQDATRVSRAPKLNKRMAWVDFNQPAAMVSARIRGLSPWPGCLAELISPLGQTRTTVILLKCRARSDDRLGQPAGKIQADLTIACRSGTVELLQVQPLGRKMMDFRSFVNGYGLQPGWLWRSAPPTGEGESTNHGSVQGDNFR